MDVRAIWCELDTNAALVDVRVAWAQFDPNAALGDVRISWCEFSPFRVLQLLVNRSKFFVSSEREAMRVESANELFVAGKRRG